jgi:hypothetical protein
MFGRQLKSECTPRAPAPSASRFFSLQRISSIAPPGALGQDNVHDVALVPDDLGKARSASLSIPPPFLHYRGGGRGGGGGGGGRGGRTKAVSAELVGLKERGAEGGPRGGGCVAEPASAREAYEQRFSAWGAFAPLADFLCSGRQAGDGTRCGGGRWVVRGLLWVHGGPCTRGGGGARGGRRRQDVPSSQPDKTLVFPAPHSMY